MRIVVNDIAASCGGAMTILKEFYNYVKENDGGNEWIFLLGQKYFEETENVKIIEMPKIKNSKIKKLWFDFFGGKKFINKLKPDVVVSLQNIITFGLKVPQIVYMHQSIPFQSQKNFSFFKRSELSLAVIQKIIGRIIKKSVKKADRVIVQTQWIKDAVIEKTKIPAEKVYTVMVDIEDYSFLKKDGEWEKDSFFYPTSDYTYKNNGIIVEAVKELRQEGLDGVTIKFTLPFESEEETKEGVVKTGIMPKNECIAEYNTSSLVFASYIESVGLPMLEARQLGTIVLASDCPFSREVLSGYENAYFFNPFDKEELKSLMRKVALGEIDRKEINYEKNKEETSSWERIVNVIYDRREKED